MGGRGVGVGGRGVGVGECGVGMAGLGVGVGGRGLVTTESPVAMHKHRQSLQMANYQIRHNLCTALVHTISPRGLPVSCRQRPTASPQGGRHRLCPKVLLYR